MSPPPPEPMDVDNAPPSDNDEQASPSGDNSDAEAPADLMVVSRSRRANAGNRMSTLLAQAAQEDDEWGEEWAEAPNEEEFVGDEANEQDDYNMDSSSSDGDDDEGADDDTGEKELRRAERQERIKKRKPATNPFAARLAAAARKKVKLDVPTADQAAVPPRPKKKSERASWIPTPEDGPIRTSTRKQTVANKEHTMAKLKAKDRRRDDTLAMMKAAEARKAKDEPKTLTQAERLAEAARVERVNSKSLHRWEIAEEQRAAERQAQIDALKNRQIEGPFVRYYSGPAIFVDDKAKYTGKNAPSLEEVEKEVNKKAVVPKLEPSESATDSQPNGVQPTASEVATQPTDQDTKAESLTAPEQTQVQVASEPPTAVAPQHPPDSTPLIQDVTAGSSSMPYSSSIMLAEPESASSFLFGLEQYATDQQAATAPDNAEPPPQPPPTSSAIPPTQAAPATLAPTLPTNPFPPASHPDGPALPPNPFFGPLTHDDPALQHPANPQTLLQQFQRPPSTPMPPVPPRKKTIRRALRNLLILTSFPDLDHPSTSTTSRARTTTSLLKEKDRNALIALSTTLFAWSPSDASTFVTSMLSAPKTKKERDSSHLPKRKRELCAVTNQVARYKDPGTGIAYRDQKAFKVLRGVVGGGFVWSGGLGCYVGGRARERDSSSSGVKPAVGVPERFAGMGMSGGKGMGAAVGEDVAGKGKENKGDEVGKSAVDGSAAPAQDGHAKATKETEVVVVS